jgi:2-C-methyl-D-erythritol 2,4-cyclodiphosphate synthase
MVNLAAGKNSTDIALAVDTMELVMRERPDVLAIASSDSDFAPLVTRVREKGWELVNVDSTIVAQAPKLAPHMAAINASVAKALSVQPDQVNVKAKTAEKLGPVGMGQSIEARAMALLVFNSPRTA